MPTQLTLEDLLTFIAEIYGKEAARPQRRLYLTYMNEAIGIIGDIMGPVETSWTNAEGGGLTLSGMTCAVPIDCVTPLTLEWDSVPLRRADRATFDSEDGLWRTATGTPAVWYSTGTHIYIDVTPTGTTVGMLRLRGLIGPPYFSEVAEAANPLTSIPQEFQLLPADYCLAQLPVIPMQPASGNPEAIRYAEMQTQMRIAARDKHSERWAEGFARLSDRYAKRQGTPFTYA